MVIVDAKKFFTDGKPKNNFVYLLTKEGIFAFYENDVFKVCIPILEAPCIEATGSIYDFMEEELPKNGVKILKRIPKPIFEEILEFYKEHREKEHCLLIMKNENEGFFLYEPPQSGSLAHVKYQVPYGKEVVATIHNHPASLGLPNFSAVDDRDAKFMIGADILVYQSYSLLEMRARFTLMGHIVPLAIEELFELS